jgi:hypoxanthine-DNA glycosylase
MTVIPALRGEPVISTAQSVGFPPLLGESPRLLILGSLPGQASLAAQQYYAMPRNAFWTVISAYTGVAATAPYTDRCAALIRIGIAVWDVCASAQRSGSLDAHIWRRSVRANPIGHFLAEQPSIRALLFNGQTAAQLYTRHIRPSLSGALAALPQYVLPSTSPAHAAVSVTAKSATWDKVLRTVLVDPPLHHTDR